MPNLTAITKSRDYSDIIKLKDPDVLESFLQEPLTFIAETITGAFAVKTSGLMASGGRIVQSILKAKLFEQWAKEFKKLREEGRIPDDFANKKYGFQTWVELMSIIDEDSPDADRLEALKAMFLAVNRVNVTDGEQIAAYHLWQITKNLSSGELLVLKTVYDNLNFFGSETSYAKWASVVAQRMGHGVLGLVDLYEEKLTKLHLLTARYQPDRSAIRAMNGRLTDLGMKLCMNIRTYQTEMGQRE